MANFSIPTLLSVSPTSYMSSGAFRNMYLYMYAWMQAEMVKLKRKQIEIASAAIKHQYLHTCAYEYLYKRVHVHT